MIDNGYIFARLFEIQALSDNYRSKLDNLNILFYYFQLESKYFLLIFGKISTAFELANNFYSSIVILKEITKKKRKIRSFRGLFLYALEMIETNQRKGKFYVIETNLDPCFWQQTKIVINKNQKDGLLSFLLDCLDSKQNKISIINLQIQYLETEILKLSAELIILKRERRRFYKNLN